MRIILILPCCIGDVVLGTATLAALRRAYPAAHITWAVGTWSRPALENHPLLNALLDTGEGAMPTQTVAGILRFARQLRAGGYDMVVSLVRSPKMSLAVWLSGIPVRAGLDSAGRGFGYNVRARTDPDVVRHEAEIYLDVPHALGIDTSGCYANVPVFEAARAEVMSLLRDHHVEGRYLVVHPGGGSNPGMSLDAKRYPPPLLAAVAERVARRYEAQIILIGGRGDALLIAAVQAHLSQPAPSFAGALTFPQIGALAASSLLYIGNDTGLTHYAAAAGAKTVMLLGPTDPARYAPFTLNSLALWKPTAVAQRGVAGGISGDWDWARDGIGVDEAEDKIMEWLTAQTPP